MITIKMDGGKKVSMREEWKEKASHTGMNEWIKLH